MKNAAIATVLLTLGLYAGCATTYRGTFTAADTFESSVAEFATRTCYEPGAVCSAAVQLSGRAQEFREALDSAGDQDIISAYKQLWRSYQSLRGEVYRLSDKQLRQDLQPTVRAFASVKRNVTTRYSSADPALYANGAYTFDPYYN